MTFWDASAVIPLCVDEVQTQLVRDIAKKDGGLVVWWGSIVESYSAFARLRRDRSLSSDEEAEGLGVLSELANAWTEIEPSDDIREITRRLLRNYPLRAADSLQLAAALVWCDKTPKGHHFVCLDIRLREAALKEGFTVIPFKL
jgi:uncharacterized protein